MKYSCKLSNLGLIKPDNQDGSDQSLSDIWPTTGTMRSLLSASRRLSRTCHILLRPVSYLPMYTHLVSLLPQSFQCDGRIAIRVKLSQSLLLGNGQLIPTWTGAYSSCRPAPVISSINKWIQIGHTSIFWTIATYHAVLKQAEHRMPRQNSAASQPCTLKPCYPPC